MRAVAATAHNPLGRRRWFGNTHEKQRFYTSLAQCSGLHIHGLWQEHSAASAAYCAATRKPYVVSAHGFLERWALRNRGWKKALYGKLVEYPNLARAGCLIALTEVELGDYRRIGLRNPVAVIPNGVDQPEFVSPRLFTTAFPETEGKFLVLFLGRIHYKKGLDILARSWADVAASYPDAHLVMAGPDIQGNRALMERQIQELGLQRRVTFTGMLDGDLKWSAVFAASVFVLPSYSEGLSGAVLQALSAGLPVIISHQCNMPCVADHGAGWVIEPEFPRLSAALREALSATPGQLRQIGAKGHQLTTERYSWETVARQAAEVYDWLLHGSPPSFTEIHR